MTDRPEKRSCPGSGMYVGTVIGLRDLCVDCGRKIKIVKNHRLAEHNVPVDTNGEPIQKRASSKKCESPDHERRVTPTRNYCATCHSREMKKYRQRALEADPDFYKKRYAKHKAQPDFAERRAREQRRRKYGFEIAPSGLCQICGERPATDLDHDHKTGVIRGFLCHGCNLVLGYVEKQGNEWGRRAEDYLASPPLPLAVPTEEAK